METELRNHNCGNIFAEISIAETVPWKRRLLNGNMRKLSYENSITEIFCCGNNEVAEAILQKDVLWKYSPRDRSYENENVESR